MTVARPEPSVVSTAGNAVEVSNNARQPRRPGAALFLRRSRGLLLPLLILLVWQLVQTHQVLPTNLLPRRAGRL